MVHDNASIRVYFASMQGQMVVSVQLFKPRKTLLSLTVETIEDQPRQSLHKAMMLYSRAYKVNIAYAKKQEISDMLLMDSGVTVP